MTLTYHREVERIKIVELSQKTLWEEQTADVEEALRYLRNERKISDDVIKKFRFGYFPKRLKTEDNWAGRLIIPLYDQYDRLVILTSRDFRCGKSGMPHLHEEFDKKLYLFGLNVAKDNIIKYQKAIVVEGQFDTACSHTHGYGVTVGVLGSALSMFHVNILARYCSEIFLVFDMDESGFKSLARTMYMYKYYGLDSMGIKFIPVILPKHKDPDEFLRKEDSKEYMKLLVEAKQRVLEKGSIGYYNILKQLHPQIVVATSKGK